MAYSAPYVDSAGLVVSSYTNIMDDNLEGVANIYGSAEYLGTDSALYQMTSLFSLKIADCHAALQFVYNQLSPQTAVGTGLDRNLKMNGLARSSSTYSTVTLTLTGTASATITDAVAQDTSGYMWELPSSVTFDSSGDASVTATCTTTGSISSAVGTITIMATPLTAWLSVTNPAAADVGDSVEADSEARARQAISVALPGLTMIEATKAAVLAVSGVTRIDTGRATPSAAEGTSIENPTSATDAWGNPEHSISMVVEGGTDSDVATAIYKKHGIGCYMNGTTAVTVTDSNTGYQTVVRFRRPTYVTIYVTATLVSYTSTSVTTATQTSVQTAVVNYLASLTIGETVSYAALMYEIMSVNASLTSPTFGVSSLYVGTSASPTGTSDISMSYHYNVSTATTSTVTVTA